MRKERGDFLNNRKYRILDVINQRGYARFADLCTEFDVSAATMRRDLVSLDQEGLIHRVHGGAKSIHSPAEQPNVLSTHERSILAPQEKVQIAQCAFQMLHNGDSIILDDSTTCLELAKIIASSKLTLNIITNSFDIALLLQEHLMIELFFIGGIVHKTTAATYGSIAEQIARSLNCNILFAGADAVHPEKGFLNNRLNIIPLKQAMIGASSQTIVLADHTKFNRSAMMQIAPFDAIDYVITDDQLTDDVYNAFGKYKSQIIRAEIDDLPSDE